MTFPLKRSVCPKTSWYEWLVGYLLAYSDFGVHRSLLALAYLLALMLYVQAHSVVLPSVFSRVHRSLARQTPISA